MTWGDSHGSVVQLQASSRLPGRHSKAHYSHKDGENQTWIWSLFFLHMLSNMSSQVPKNLWKKLILQYHAGPQTKIKYIIIIRLFSCMIIRLSTICHMGLQKKHPVVGEKSYDISTDLIYGEEDSISPSTLIFAAIKG